MRGTLAIKEGVGVVEFPPLPPAVYKIVQSDNRLCLATLGIFDCMRNGSCICRGCFRFGDAGERLRLRRVRVESILDLETERPVSTAVPWMRHAPHFVYRTGTKVIADPFDPDPLALDTSGIHCFITREAALSYMREQLLRFPYLSPEASHLK